MGPLVSFLAEILAVCLIAAEPAQAEPMNAAVPELPAARQQPVSFTKDVRPILEQKCWSCHGKNTWEAGLRLDRKDRALQGGDGGAVVVVGKSAESRLIQIVSGWEPDRVMPPDDERLTAAEIGILRAWIDQGLDWPKSDTAVDEPAAAHWAFQPIRQPAIPAASGSGSAHPIDRFVDARLAEHQLVASGAASRAQLIRRLSLDLLGLLPTETAVNAFVHDNRPQAYEELVDQLLASPHFGERWGRHWLDLARYADSDGYEKDLARPFAYRYRDWVIDALNADMPFDQFTVEQLAGDLLPEPTLSQKLATGFHRQTLTNREGGIDPREDRDKQLVDRTNTTGAVWLGLTLGCAQCHTHKYDPITQREYFQIYAFFNAAQEQDIDAPTALESARYEQAQAEHQRRRQPLADAINRYRAEQLPAKLAEWEQRLSASPVVWEPADVTQAVTASKAKLERQVDGVWLATGDVADVDTYTFTLAVGQQRPRGLLIETLPHAALPESGPGRAPNGNFVLTQLKAAWQPAGSSKEKPQPLTLRAAQADYVQNAGQPTAFSPEKTLNGDSKTGWAVGGGVGKPHAIAVEIDWSTLPDAERDLTLTITLEQNYGRQHLLGAVRLLTTSATPPLSLPQLAPAIADILKTPADQRSSAQQQQLLQHYASIDPELLTLTEQLQKRDAAGPQKPPTRGMVFKQAEKPATTHVNLRGDFLSPGATVEPAVLEVLNPLTASDGLPTRLDLANWLIHEDNPLTRRVAVNRIWQHLFGRGLVDPPDDFGLRGTPPTHPELLDWLAVEFSRRGWSTKALIRLIVTSKAYQRSSQGRPDLEEVDPKNLWLARQNRFRLTGEILRDIALDVSGLLDDRIGGPGIRPPLPEGVAALGYAGSVKWPESQGGDRYRRGSYIFFQRTVPYPLLMTFDGPDSNVTCQRRERSNTPLQSLTLLNDPAFVESARALGRRIVTHGGPSVSDRLHAAVRWTLSRDPSEQEIGVLMQLHSQAVDQFRNQPAAAAQFAGVKPPTTEAEQAAVEESAVWSSLARILLNLDEFLNRE